MASSWASWRRLVSSRASAESFSPRRSGGADSERIKVGSDWKSSRELRHSAAGAGSNRWFSTAETRSGSISGQSPVTPKAPSVR